MGMHRSLHQPQVEAYNGADTASIYTITTKLLSVALFAAIASYEARPYRRFRKPAGECCQQVEHGEQ